jgi:hypothetical protein
MNYELFAVILVMIIYWYFNVKEQFVVVPVPLEKMSNISIFDEELKSHNY